MCGGCLSLKLTKSVFALIAVVCITLAMPAFAEPPKLAENGGATLPQGELQPGTSLTFNMRYSGDPPTDLDLMVQTPDGDTIKVPAALPAGDSTQGVDVTWVYKPLNSGVYHYYFEAKAGDLGSVRYPTDSADDYTFDSVNLGLKWIFFAIGALIALLLLPLIIYSASRAFNKRSDAGMSARIGVFIGVLALYGLFVYLFLPIYHTLGAGLGAVAVIAVLILLFSRK